MEDTYITLYSHQYFQIVNKSSVPVEFSWRAFQTEVEENKKKSQLIAQLNDEESEERMILEESNLEESVVESLDSDDSYDEDELNRKQERAQTKAITTLARKYQSIRKAVEEDLMLFQDEIFNIEPLQGKLWPNTEITCCVTFKPQGPLHYSCTAFCNITCSEERLPLNLTGQGIGPKAALSIKEWDIGDIFVNSEQEYRIAIENKGDITCYYKLIPYETPFGSKFHFSKTEGKLGVTDNQSDIINVAFKSDILGEFSETFRWALEGSVEMLSLTFKGHVVAPTFKFSEEIIDFGQVSYKFPAIKTVYLTNTSDVDINYVIRVPGDERSLQNEFNITNDRGRLSPKQRQKIIIEFIPSSQRQYDMCLMVDLEGVGQDMLAVPIKAECLVPKVKITPGDYLDFKDVFLRHPKTMEMELKNEDYLEAKFEILPQEDNYKRVGIFKADQERGIIPPRSAIKLQITLKTEMITQNVRIPMSIKVEGYHIPFMINILANSTGPKVEYDHEELDFNSVDVLHDVIKPLKITNVSKIPAEYTAFTKNKVSIWKVIQRHGILQPDESKTLDVVCNADECQKFTDTLHIIINNGVDLEVGLKAKGVGTTLACKDNLKEVNFGTKYTHCNETMEFFLENRGRKPQKIKWTRVNKPNDRNKAKAKPKEGAKEDSKNETSIKDASMISEKKAEEGEELKYVFAVVPDEVELQPKMGIFIQFRANSFQKGRMAEEFVCTTIVKGERKPKEAYKTTCVGEFIGPQLEYSDPKLMFKYKWEKNVPAMPIQKPLDITNVGNLATTITLKIVPPFSCNTEVLTLPPGQKETINIDFDPGMRQDRMSGVNESKLQITHKGHPQKDFVELFGEVCYPNLSISPPNISFGCILNDTSKKRYITMTNISEMVCTYDWSFLEEETTSLNKNPDETETKKKKKDVPINEIFDILPVSGILKEGETETVEFTYYAGHGMKYNGIAVCSVEGGPDYQVPLVGESSFVSYKLSTNEIDYGEITYCHSDTKEFYIENIGKVPFEFNINLSTITRPGLVEVTPMTGKVMSGERFRVNVKFKPGIPDNIDEIFLVECAHFPAERMKIKAVGTYPGALLTFPRHDETFQERFEKTKKLLEKKKIKYDAKFTSSEVKDVPTGKGKQDKFQLDLYQMDVEAEADRIFLCEKLLENLEVSQARTAIKFNDTKQNTSTISPKKGGRTSPGRTQGADLDKSGAIETEDDRIVVSNYICDFGNMVVGSSKKKTFRMTNCGKNSLNFSFDARLLQQMGIAIDPPKPPKQFAPNTSMQFTVVFTTRKNAKHGKVRHIVPIHLSYGPSYTIEFVANLTIPELSMSTDNVEFNKVCVGTRKIIRVRFENKKEVPCDWSHYFKPDVAGVSTKEGEKFSVSPTSGYLLPGQKQTVDIIFTPTHEKVISQKLQFKCKENSKLFALNVKGHGINYAIDIIENSIEMGPVLPYDKSAVKQIELKNPMSFPIEVYSTEFDKQFLAEEEILRRFDLLNTEKGDVIFEKLRKAGTEFWPNIIEADERRKKFDAMHEKVKAIDDRLNSEFKPPVVEEGKEPEPLSDEKLQEKTKLEQEKAEIEHKIMEMEAEQNVVKKTTPKVKTRDRLSIILFGPEKCGKSTIAYYLSEEQQRGVVNLSELVAWCEKNNTPHYEEIAKYLAERDEECKKEEELDKKKKKKKDEEEFDPTIYKFLPKEMIVKLIQDRVKHEDCNAGMIFDNLKSENWKDEKVIIDAICDALQEENVHLLTIALPKGDDGLEYCEHYRYQMRKRAIDQTMHNETLDKTFVEKDKTEKKAGGKRGKKKELTEEEKKEIEDKKHQAEEEEKAKQAKEEEVRKRLDEPEPKKLTDEEINEYNKQYDEIIELFTEINLRQMNQKHEAVGEGDTEDKKEEPKQENKDIKEIEEQDKPEGEGEAEKEEPKPEPPHFGTRIMVEVPMQYNFRYLCEKVRDNVPDPVWPDPDKEPLPAPTIQQIIKKPNNRLEKPKVTLFSIWTPVDKKVETEEEEQNKEPEKVDPKAKGKKEDKKGKPTKEEPKEPEGEVEEDKGPHLDKSITRWILQPNESKALFIKFFSTKTGKFNQTLNFEVVGSTKQFPLEIKALCEFPTINTNAKNIFMTQKRQRPANPPESYLQKTFVVTEGVFDFGPLLIGKDAEKRNTDEALKKANSYQFRISNNGKYDLNVKYALESSLTGDEPQAHKSPFIFEPDHMSLKIDQTEYLTVWCFPEENKVYQDKIVALIKDNPNPAIFNLQCTGAKPVVKIDNPIVQFDRLLLNKPAKRTLKLTNDCQIPVKWELKSANEIPAEFKISKTEGVLKPCQDVEIEVAFSSERQDKFVHKLTLNVEDTEGYNIKQEPQDIDLLAEAFDITVDIDLKNDENILDFGAVRVGEPKQKVMTLKNIGKYPVKYGFNMKKKNTRELFTIEPSEGELQPEETKDVIVRFESKKEFKLKTTQSTSDIKLTVLEGASKEKFSEIPINFNVNSVFSKYTIVPLRNINFGPMQYGEHKELAFEIKNNGLFPFHYAICDYNDEEAKKTIKAEREKEIKERRDEALGVGHEEAKDTKGKKAAEPKAAKPGKDAKGAAVPDGEELKVSQYSIRPKQGVIEPENSASIKIQFTAQGAQFYERSLAIDISGRDLQDQPEGIKFDISAESCIPGINTEDLDQVFEEQTVIPSLDPSVNTQSVITSSLYAIQERVFWFGTLIASKVPEGVVEKFKIMNPNKIPCTVKFSVKPRSQSKNEGFAFEVSPQSVKIPPHENAYVKVSFKPENMMPYGGIFEAVVENGDPESNSGKFSFELRGEGTLPTLLLSKPTELTPEGLPLLKLKKTRIGKKTTGTITLHNEGAVPATVKFKPLTHDSLEFKGEMSRTLEPKEYYSCDIEFIPTATETIKYQMEFETVHNPYECHKVVIVAEGYQETVTFENLPEDQEDKLKFGDAVVKKSKTVSFNMLNTSDKPIRFDWSIAEPGFTFTPSVGYLRPKSSKPIKVRFITDEPVDIKEAVVTCDTKTITQDTSEFIDWDDGMTEIKMIRPSELKKILAIKEAKERRKKEEAEAAAAAAAKKGKKPPPKKEDERLPEEDMPIDENEEATEEYAEPLPEPHFTAVEGSDKQSTLKASVTADYAKYQCTIDKIIFRPTLMFSTRSYKFNIKNTSTIAISYNFKIINANTGISDSGPYTISPRSGTIPAGTDEIVIVKFSPQEVEPNFTRVLSCRIPNLAPDINPLTIKLDGLAERPVCHFELPPSTYREKKGKDMTPIDSKYSIIEFQSLGTRVKNTNGFMVANPTSHRYDFVWEEIENDDPAKPETKKEKPMFRCLTPKGTILSGKKFKMTFEYTPDNVGEHESYWNFKIPSEGITQPFMVVGYVVEPIVLFDTGKTNFGPILLGGKSRETVNLINQEHLPFTFFFDKSSIKENPDYGDSLQVTPMSGTVPPQSQLPIEVMFKPKYETEYNYNLICNVKRKARPLVLNAKGVGFAIHYNVLADKAGIPVLASESHNFEFGDFFVNEKKTKSITIENKGDFNFDYQFKRLPNKYITIEPETGTVMKGNTVHIDIVYLPTNAHKLKNYKCTLKIASGPKFNFLLNGNARKPGIQMSFHQYDFGPCFVTRQPMPTKAVLELVNNDDSAISIETNFEKKPFLDVQLSPGEVLLPSTKDKEEKLLIPIIFTPREIKKYYEVVTLDFNGIYKIDLVLKGEGIPMNIELVDPDQHILDFGTVAKGSDITKTVNLVNKSRKAVQFSLTAAVPEDLIKNSITITPSEEVTLKPKKELPIEVRFNPKTRMPDFSHDILLDIKGNEARKLFTVQGVSHGIELKLMEEVVGFGSVVKGSRLTKQLQLANFGDIRAKFKWDTKAYSKFFTIVPDNGYIPPHEDIYLEITFHPNKVDNDICVKNIKCEYTGGSSLNLTLMGKCVAPDKEATKEIHFETIVRKATTQSIMINNPTDKEWRIKPTIATNVDSIKEYFKGGETLVVPPKGNAEYKVTYFPLTMTKEKEVAKENEEEKEKDTILLLHEASLFFPLPDGRAEYYNLFGKSLKPEASASFSEKVEAKKAKYINIPVENWLKTTQRFKVTTKIEGVADETTFIRGANTFDVQAGSTKDYKLNFLTYKAGETNFTVTFLNEQTGEFIVFKVKVEAGEPGIQSTIELACPVRETTSKMIIIENPTSKEVTINKSEFVIDNEYIEIAPASLTIPPQSERGFEISYRPLIVTEQNNSLTLNSGALGTYKYDLVLKGLVSTAQRSLHFKCTLGSELMQQFKFKHYLKKATTYAVKCEDMSAHPSTCFKVEQPNVQAPAAENSNGVGCSVNIRFEPNIIGESRAVVKLTSPENIEYTCLLYGHSTAPQPQGPFKIPPGKPVPIEFKNPLVEKAQFIATFDNPSFMLASKMPDFLDPGKPVQLQITKAKADGDGKHPPTGRMIVSTKGLPPWIYYLSSEE